MSNLIHGVHAVEAVLKFAPDRVVGLFIAKSARHNRLQKVIAYADNNNIPISWSERAELDKISNNCHHQGVLVRVTRTSKKVCLKKILKDSTSPVLVLILDRVQDPYNLGACLRSAAAAGVQAVIVPTDQAVGITSTVYKTACGAAETIPFVRVTNLVRTIEILKQYGVWIIGADCRGKSTIYQTDLTIPIAIVLGSEAKGLRRLTYEACDGIVHIPIDNHVVNSLNVSVAAGILLFEARRQRLNLNL